MGGAFKQKLPRYAAFFLAWTAFGLFNFSKELTRRLYWHERPNWQEMLASWMVGIYIAAALTPAVLWLGRRLPIEKPFRLQRTALHILLSLIFSVVELALETVSFNQLGLLASVMKGSFRIGFPVLLVAGFHENIITYWAVLGIQAGSRYYRGYQERELHASELRMQLVRARLSALKMQLQPHFLFNTLNAIMVLVRQQKGPQAEEMLSRLSDLLRCVLDDVESQQVSLSRELEYVRLYLSIEQVRFRDRLGVEISVDPAVLDAAVPHMGLQPIVENAVRHGIGRNASAGTIRISASLGNALVKIEVRDDGPGLPVAGVPDGRGIGLVNTRARLQQLYGEAAKLTLENGRSGGAVATMILPYQPVHEIAEEEQHALKHAGR
jgi:signal transduction histidine kinase